MPFPERFAAVIVASLPLVSQRFSDFASGHYERVEAQSEDMCTHIIEDFVCMYEHVCRVQLEVSSLV